MTANPARSNPAKMRNSREEGTVGMGPGGLLGGNDGSRTPVPVSLRGGGLRVKFIFVFGEVVGHGRKCYSVAEKLSIRGGRPVRR